MTDVMTEVRPLSDEKWLVHIGNSGECIQPYRTPDGQFVRCGTRDASVCPGCANLYGKDASARIRSGVFDPPPGQKPAQYLFLTLTAPSFGRVHYVPSHGGGKRRCGCGAIHDADTDSTLRGVPLNVDDYEYEGLVRWNNGAGVLWDSSRRRLERLLGDFDYVVVREWQRRGVLHLHVILRLKVPALPSVVLDVARSATATVQWSGYKMTWGEQGDCQVLSLSSSSGAVEAARTIWYVGKALGYSLKSLTEGFTHRPGPHLKRMIVAARYISCGAEGCIAGRVGQGPCRAGPHKKYGSRERAIHMSRSWSWTGLTQEKQRKARHEWAKEHASDPDVEKSWAAKQKMRASAASAMRNLGRRARYDDERTEYGGRSSWSRRGGSRRRVDIETGEIMTRTVKVRDVDVEVEVEKAWFMPSRPSDYDDQAWEMCCEWWQCHSTAGERRAYRESGLPSPMRWTF